MKWYEQKVQKSGMRAWAPLYSGWARDTPVVVAYKGEYYIAKYFINSDNPTHFMYGPFPTLDAAKTAYMLLVEVE